MTASLSNISETDMYKMTRVMSGFRYSFNLL